MWALVASIDAQPGPTIGRSTYTAGGDFFLGLGHLELRELGDKGDAREVAVPDVKLAQVRHPLQLSKRLELAPKKNAHAEHSPVECRIRACMRAGS